MYGSRCGRHILPRCSGVKPPRYNFTAYNFLTWWPTCWSRAAYRTDPSQIYCVSTKMLNFSADLRFLRSKVQNLIIFCIYKLSLNQVYHQQPPQPPWIAYHLDALDEWNSSTPSTYLQSPIWEVCWWVVCKTLILCVYGSGIFQDCEVDWPPPPQHHGSEVTSQRLGGCKYIL